MIARGLLVALFSLIAAPVVSSPELAYNLEAREVAPDTWVIEGSTGNFSRDNGGNIVNVSFVITDDGVVVIDTGPSRLYGEALRRLVESKTSQPIRYVLNTHHHPDHVFGNQAFEPETLYMLETGRQRLREDGDAFSDNMYRMVGDWMRGTDVVVPPNTLQPGILDVGDHRFQILELTGHTGSDMVLLDETTGVLFASDMVFYNRALTTPQSPGLMIWAGEIARLEALPYRIVVPGHGPVVSDDSAFRQMSDYLEWLYQTMSMAASRGLSASEVMQQSIPHRFDGIEGARYELIRTTSHLYPKYEQAALELLPE
ncbi:quinoprotein relay system zinc metallohydrolase 1 [Marinobacter mobilis]|uniref:Quinoprotein relay system zinc metallohydrolase 1 n=1 Tax=Marinobacter mobilis TaxID=488533 RepID=A0A1H3ATL7_9GAMM|nr:quinoprotein relay system zinc metallohydrolase 1 [Marinobacter mobilis]SDX32474.1 quinoprotein relay system zinc metallohydrolase 1 [Marinobacter mobilis]